MRIGVVVKVITDKKIGFIRSEDLREDVFFHFSKVENTIGSTTLIEGDEVEYEIDELQRINKSLWIYFAMLLFNDTSNVTINWIHWERNGVTRLPIWSKATRWVVVLLRLKLHLLLL